MTIQRTLSVVVPTFNSEFIDRLNAVLANSCQDFEVILVNEGRSDYLMETHSIIKIPEEGFHG